MSWFENNSSAGGKKRIVRTMPVSGRVISNKKNRASFGSGSKLFARAMTWLMAVIFIGVTGYMLFFSPVLHVASVIIAGQEIVPIDSVKEVADAALSGKYLGVLSKRNIIFLDKNNIQKSLLEKFKKIKTVKIVKNFPDKLLINIVERESALIFCSGDSCHVIDSEGLAYAQPNFQAQEFGESDLMVLRDSSQNLAGGRDISLDKGLLDFINGIADRLKRDLEIDIKKECDTPMLISGDIRIETTDGVKIYFNKDLGVNKEMEMLKTVLINSLDKGGFKDLEYIDLRVDNKVYSKPKS